MRTVVIRHEAFEESFPGAIEHLIRLLATIGSVETYTIADDVTCLSELVAQLATVDAIFMFGGQITDYCLSQLKSLKAALFLCRGRESADRTLSKKGVPLLSSSMRTAAGVSIAEHALLLTLVGLRLNSSRGAETVLDDEGAEALEFVPDVLLGKHVCVVGLEGAGALYARLVSAFRAELSAFSPSASDSLFDALQVRRFAGLNDSVQEMQVLTIFEDSGAEVPTTLVHALPRGCLVVIPDKCSPELLEAVAKRAAGGEIVLAADLLPADVESRLEGLPNVVHTRGVARTTVHTGRKWAQNLFDKLLKVNGE